LLLLPFFLWVGRPRGAWARGRAILAMVLRSLIVIALVLALAGLQTVRATDSLAVVYLIDNSDSMPPATVESARQFVEESLQAMRPEDQAAVIVFGSDALVERPMSPVRDVGPIESQVLPLHTDLAEAIRLGLALYPPGAARRMVILSDGLVNVGDAERAARLAAASGVEIVAVPFSAIPGPEVLVTDVDLPTRLNEGQVFDLTVSIESSAETAAILRIVGNGRVVAEETVALVEGVNRYAFTLTAEEPGLVNYRVQLVPAGDDVFYQNNELSAFAQVTGPPTVLVVTGNPVESQNLEAALVGQGILVDRVISAGFPGDLATLSGYQSVVLVNVPARDLGPRKMQLLQIYVRDLGGGLVVVGGEHAYAPGGYFDTPLEEMLPVEMQLKDQERLPQMTVVYVLDRSGSMADYSPGGFAKLELAKEAVIRSVALLGPLDRVGVVTFDTEAAWAVPIGPADNRTQIANLVGGIRAGGGTDIYAGLLAVSRQLPNDPSMLRHIILLTDGGASEQGIPELVKEMYTQYGITMSVIAITAESEQYGAFIEDLPDMAGGRFYHAYNVDTIPEIFTEDTIIATRAYIMEEEFFPALTSSSPILTGIGATPSLMGYVGATIKPTGRQVLATGHGDPLLATWQYGLGRSVAWTSDATGRWAANWVTWEDFARFWSQAVRWTISEGINQNVEVSVTQEGEQVRISVDAVDSEGAFLNGLEMDANIVDPDLGTTPLTLPQVAPGRYEATFEPTMEGAYFVRIAGADQDQQGSQEQPSVAQTAGWVMAYSPEYRSFEGDPAYIGMIAGLTGGSVVADPRTIFTHNLDTQHSARPIWPTLLLVAAILLPFDIAVRRLVITRADFVKLAARLRPRRRTSEPVPVGASRVGALLEVKDRVAHERHAVDLPDLPDLTGEPTLAGDSTRVVEEKPKRTPSKRPEPAAGGSTVSSLLSSKRSRREDDSQD
ncbi:MAG: VWA domain-containing protein, partial [Anaerolineae bacterium]|nr:VWA domain-containing protein [Anaerolineae bacterium]